MSLGQQGGKQRPEGRTSLGMQVCSVRTQQELRRGACGTDVPNPNGAENKKRHTRSPPAMKKDEEEEPSKAGRGEKPPKTMGWTSQVQR